MRNPSQHQFQGLRLAATAVLLLALLACNREVIPPEPLSYAASGRIADRFGNGLGGIRIYHNANGWVPSDSGGNWTIEELSGRDTLWPVAQGFTFTPLSAEVDGPASNILFEANRIPDATEAMLFNWFSQQQLDNGLLESAENGNIVSLYDNALAAMVFMLRGNVPRAEKIFDFFNARITTELKSGPGGFSQLRDRNGTPNNHRWMGDNAWLLIALNTYKSLTGNSTYDPLAAELSNWLIGLQDSDGGLFAGYDASGALMNYKVTEGNIDAFNAISGYTTFHSRLLGFLKRDRWDAATQSLVSWPGNPPYLFALDLHPWSYSIFEQFPVATLTEARRFLTTQTATNGVEVTGYCFDEDKDAVWPEGTGQMAVAFGLASMTQEKELHLSELKKLLIQSQVHANAAGFPYASNPATGYGGDALWPGADTNIALSGAAWYLFAAFDFNPFAAGRRKDIPAGERFWVE